MLAFRFIAVYSGPYIFSFTNTSIIFSFFIFELAYTIVRLTIAKIAIMTTITLAQGIMNTKVKELLRTRYIKYIMAKLMGSPYELFL